MPLKCPNTFGIGSGHPQYISYDFKYVLEEGLSFFFFSPADFFFLVYEHWRGGWGGWVGGWVGGGGGGGGGASFNKENLEKLLKTCKNQQKKKKNLKNSICNC